MSAAPSPRCSAPSTSVPQAAPAWVTPELITHTLRVWQRYYVEPLKPEDALAMILGVSKLNRVISEGSGA
ncbi:hypothetical protein [Planctomyces sp. SH-PL14]|uniref:hypothetical protein n=1 Tax=Planctomyces sp. SH-PL14 TaxID=1632864 RepID=UPI00078EA6EF|nr:hypothetical protein [Planctomyces sp. SH-PL14]AMV17402.1 hypothetical protein VT03_05890 [Planctomyces sp. SH-PL14]